MSGTLTPEQVRDIIERHSMWTIGNNRCFYNGAYDDIADELNGIITHEKELIDLAHQAWSMAMCAMRGMPIPAEWGNAVEQGLRKHGVNVDSEVYDDGEA